MKNIDNALEEDTNGELRRFFGSGNLDGAIKYLYERYNDQGASIAYKILKDYDAAADVMQNVWIRLCKGIKNYDPSKIFFTWFYRVVTNASIDYLRKNGRHSSNEEIYEEILKVEDPSSDPSRKREYDRTKKIVDKTLEGMRKRRRQIMEKYISGEKYDAIADALRLPKTTVRWHVYKAREAISRALEKAA